MKLSRRQFIQFSALSLLTACTAQTEQPLTGATPSDAATNTPADTPTSASTAIASDTATATPTATVSPTATALPSATATATRLPSATPAPTATRAPTATLAGNPIKHVVIFVQENHSFDSMFAGFPGADGVAHGGLCQDANPDPPHDHASALRPNGVNGPIGDCHYSEAMLPGYWQLARAFTLCDQYHCELRGPSDPNYYMMTAAQSPIIDAPTSDKIYDIAALPNRIIDKGLTWADYGGIMNRYKSLRNRPEIITNQERIITDAQTGKLANVAWLFSEDEHSGHPPYSMCGAENWMVRVLNALMHGPEWNSTVVFCTMDEWGGFYDHVTPPVLERYTDGSPFRLGWRVPCTVVSPYAKAGYVSHQQNSHLSLLRFCETLFGLTPLTQREAQAGDMLDCFDFAQKPRAGITLAARQC